MEESWSKVLNLTFTDKKIRKKSSPFTLIDKKKVKKSYFEFRLILSRNINFTTKIAY